jgi:cytoskeletal protein RodZ
MITGRFSRSSSATTRWLGGTLLGPALLVLALTGCTSAPAAPATPSATPEVTSATPSATASASPTTSSATSSPATSSPADQVTIDITIANHQVDPNGKKIDVQVGQQIVLKVTSDTDDEIHAHTGGDGYELAVTAGKKVTGSFTLTSPGSFDVESHHLEKTIVILNAR